MVDSGLDSLKLPDVDGILIIQMPGSLEPSILAVMTACNAELRDIGIL